MGRLLKAVLLVVCLVSATVTSAAGASSQPPNSIGIRLIGASAGVVDPRARSYIVDHLAPGTVSHRQVEVANSTNSTMQMSVYAAAAAVANGSFTFAVGRTANELTTWITVDRGALSLRPHSKALVNVTISIPKDASPGERYAVIWAEVSSGPPNGSGVVVVNRIGIRVYLSVGPGGPPAADFKITSIKAGRTAAGRPTVAAVVRNTGGRAVDVGGDVQLLDGPGGVSAGPFSVQDVTTLAPGDIGTVTVVLNKGLPSGPWTASMDLKSGFVEATSQGRIRFPGRGPTVQPRRFPPAWVMAAGGVLAAALLVALALLIRRRRGVRSAAGRIGSA